MLGLRVKTLVRLFKINHGGTFHRHPLKGAITELRYLLVIVHWHLLECSDPGKKTSLNLAWDGFVSLLTFNCVPVVTSLGPRCPLAGVMLRASEKAGRWPSLA